MLIHDGLHTTFRGHIIVAMKDEVELLYREEYPRLVRALTAVCGDTDRAREAVQDAFVQAGRHWPAVRHYDDPASWVRRVAINRLIDQGRSISRRSAGDQRVANLADGALPWAIAGSVDDRSELTAASADLRRALAALPDRQRLVVALHHLADLSVNRVALLLDLPAGTVKSDLSRARSTLLRALEVIDE